MEIKNDQPITLPKSHRILENYSLFQSSVIITNFIDSIAIKYDHYERKNDKQLYYDLSDFQGYCGLTIYQFDPETKIKRENINLLKDQLVFVTGTDSFPVERTQLPSEQGLILFNGVDEPVYWKGNQPGGLDTFLLSYFTLSRLNSLH
ncbi:MAG TPA: hypothetical protein DIW47_01610 [Bacteroidetes bacterium]|nr:hypothetical protein [Bacteroidota bacterium]